MAGVRHGPMVDAMKRPADSVDGGDMADFPPGLWLALIGAVACGVIGCGCVLATAMRQQTDLHDLKVRVLNLRISYLAFMKALDESEDPDALRDDPEILARYLRGEIPYKQAAGNPAEPTPTTPQKPSPTPSPAANENAGKIEPQKTPAPVATVVAPAPARAAA